MTEDNQTSGTFVENTAEVAKLQAEVERLQGEAATAKDAHSAGTLFVV